MGRRRPDVVEPERLSKEDRRRNESSQFCIILAVASIVTPAKSGHDSPVYPSFYPQEIELTAVAPDRAADLLLAGKIQAYVGNAPRFATAPPNSIDSIELARLLRDRPGQSGLAEGQG